MGNTKDRSYDLRNTRIDHEFMDVTVVECSPILLRIEVMHRRHN